MSYQAALNQYQQVNNQQAIDGASPHRLIQLLMEGGVQRMAEAKGAIQRNDLEAKGIALGKAISIIGGLSDSLNMDIDSEISEQLASLYEYIVECLMMANLNGSEAKLNESMRLLKTIKSAWDEIASEVA